MKKSGWIALSIFLIVILAIAVAADRLLAFSATKMLEDAQNRLPAGTTFMHGELHTSLFRRVVVLDNFVYQTPIWTFKADRAVLRGVPWIDNESLSLGGIELVKPVVTGPVSGSLDQLVVGHPYIGPVKEGEASGLQFQSLEAKNLDSRYEKDGSFLRVGDLEIKNLTGTNLGQLKIVDLEAHIADINLAEKLQRQAEIRRLNANIDSLPDGPVVPAEPVNAKLEFLSADGVDLALFKNNDSTDVLNRLFFQDSLRALEIKKLKVEKNNHQDFDVDSVLFNGEDVAHNERRGLNFAIQNLKIAAGGLPPELIENLKAGGHDALLVNLTAGATFDETAHQLKIGPFELRADGLFALSAFFNLVNIRNLAQMSSPAAVASMGFKDGEISLVDFGGISRYTNMKAKNHGMTRADYVATQLNIFSQGTPLDQMPSRSRDIFTAVTRFLNEPSGVRFVAHPQDPVSLVLIFVMVQTKQVQVLLDKIGLTTEKMENQHLSQ